MQKPLPYVGWPHFTVLLTGTEPNMKNNRNLFIQTKSLSRKGCSRENFKVLQKYSATENGTVFLFAYLIHISHELSKPQTVVLKSVACLIACLLDYKCKGKQKEESKNQFSSQGFKRPHPDLPASSQQHLLRLSQKNPEGNLEVEGQIFHILVGPRL